ncbi:hypothetical protein N9955_00690 [bacterium]|nr:hypothetical protein [bacterium]
MTIKELKDLLDKFPEDQQDREVVYRENGGKLGKIDYIVKETNKDRWILAEEWF